MAGANDDGAGDASSEALPPLPDEVSQERAARLVRSGLFDSEFHATLRGRRFTDAQAAAEDYVQWGMPRELPPNPFVDFAFAPQSVRRAWRRRRVGPVLRHLQPEDAPAAPPLGLLFDPAAEGARPLDHYLGSGGADEPLPLSAGFGARGRPTAGFARRRLLDAAAQVALLEAAAGEPPRSAADVTDLQAARLDWARVRAEIGHRVAGRTTVVVPTFRDWRMTLRAVEAVLDNSGDQDVEVVVVDNGSPWRIALSLEAAFLTWERVRCIRLPHNLNFAGGSNVGFAAGTGDVVVFLNNDTYARRGWLQPLRDALDDPAVAGVQPLLLYPDETIQTAGTVWPGPGPLPCHLLVRHPREDAAGVTGERFEAITGAAMAVRAVDVARLDGFDPSYRNGFEDVDLCLRLRELRSGGFRVVPTAVVTHFESRTPGRWDSVGDNRRLFVDRWSGKLPPSDPAVYDRLGFELERVEDDGQPIASPRPVIGRRPDRPADRLRWSINLPSTGGHWGDTWGDTHFGDGLARALRSLGQDVVTRRRDAHATGPTHLDDVALAIRGRYPIAPVPGRTNLLWIISHPDTVDVAELEGFDRVYAASTVWSQQLSRAASRVVVPLLQATEVVPPEAPLGERRPEALFVGSRYDDRDRPLVQAAVDADIPLAVYGQGWEGVLPRGAWRSPYVANRELPDLYRSHALVLADHWPAMARHGFIANRVFDAVAAGARVACDPVTGLPDVFGPEVVVVRGADDLRRLHQAGCGAVRTLPETLGAARRVAQDHSFARRAEVLLADVGQLTGAGEHWASSRTEESSS